MTDHVYVITLRGKVQGVYATADSAKDAEMELRVKHPELAVQPRMIETTKHLVR